MKKICVIFLCVFALFTQIQGFDSKDGKPSFDCSKAKSVVEHLVCNDVELANLDSKMAAIYRQKSSQLNADSKKELLMTQREWIKSYNNCKTRECVKRALENRIFVIERFGIPVIFDDSGNAKPSFDCKKATSVVESLICADSNLAQMDSKMATLYKQKRSNADEDSKQELLKTQREYIKKSQNCKTKKCIEQLLESRIYYLQNYQDLQLYTTQNYNKDFNTTPKNIESKPKNIESKPTFTPKNSTLNIEYEDTQDVRYRQDSKSNYKWNESQELETKTTQKLDGFYLLRQDSPNKYRGEISISNCKNDVCAIEFSGQDSESVCVLKSKDMWVNAREGVIEFSKAEFSGCKISVTFSKNGLVLNKQEWALNCNKICPSIASGFRFKEAYDRKQAR
ncbi:hypothetical protein DCO58_00405 [Helicobacter saguini]|uniref:Lysozyme inhibitor LprI N-terminal domain-containing protein n=1 Tax=Helicobacter saguini TaxID=1548018 RepID=A0A347VZH9_9HELI|nr:lysozyme inhibitor LprI family protein [Helicobacter saguini]MWV63146.1 hypothetical protein [Helicobacter saguini]MWV66184.1 hypothetical protein [Helicobacter saguini]MWV68533.1 hypothetical protein [Helicobacter saguini]MWV71912.1 hypothetical protein [Helicobacter saguini]TLD95926.1 hypothetical protein LS64_000750 [Helicobacter saguini]